MTMPRAPDSSTSTTSSSDACVATISVFTGGSSCDDLEQRFQAGHVRHVQIEQQHVGAQQPRQPHGVAAAADVADDVEVGMTIEQFAQRLAEERVIVRDQDADRTGTGALGLDRGAATRAAGSAPLVS